MAFIEVLSPCVTYNDTYPDWMNRVHDVDADPEFQAGHRGQAFSRVFEWVQQSRIPIGHIYSGSHPSLQDGLLNDITPAEALQQGHSEAASSYVNEVLSSYAV